MPFCLVTIPWHYNTLIFCMLFDITHMIYVSYTFYLQQKLFIPERIKGSLDNTGNLALGRIIHEHNTGWVNGACGKSKQMRNYHPSSQTYTIRLQMYMYHWNVLLLSPTSGPFGSQSTCFNDLDQQSFLLRSSVWPWCRGCKAWVWRLKLIHQRVYFFVVLNRITLS